MAGTGCKLLEWLKWALNGYKGLGKGLTWLKWLEMAGNAWKWLEWLKMPDNYWNGFEWL